MRTYLILCFLSVCIFFSSCNGESTNTNSSNATSSETEIPSNIHTPKGLHKEVMRIHDEAMAKMDLIYKTKKQIKAVLKNVDTTENPEQTKDRIKEHLDGLDMADEAMMDWMRKYRQPKGQTDEEMMDYLQSEKVKIEKVGKTMDEEIEKGEKFLEEVK